MKALKFKVWDTIKQKMYKPQAISFDASSLAPFAIKVPGSQWGPTTKFEFIQWTGLCDADGREVYEGDFIEISSILYKVAWNESKAGFELIDHQSTSVLSITDLSMGHISGNQFENA
jgi:YopX protein.